MLCRVVQKALPRCIQQGSALLYCSVSAFFPLAVLEVGREPRSRSPRRPPRPPFPPRESLPSFPSLVAASPSLAALASAAFLRVASRAASLAALMSLSCWAALASASFWTFSTFLLRDSFCLTIFLTIFCSSIRKARTILRTRRVSVWTCVSRKQGGTVVVCDKK